jgi:hypothetical protein
MTQHLDLIVPTIDHKILIGFIVRVNRGADSAPLPSLDRVRAARQGTCPFGALRNDTLSTVSPRLIPRISCFHLGTTDNGGIPSWHASPNYKVGTLISSSNSALVVSGRASVDVLWVFLEHHELGHPRFRSATQESRSFCRELPQISPRCQLPSGQFVVPVH